MLRAFDAGGGNSSFAFNKSVDSDDVLVGDTHFLLGAEFKRSGPDLILLGDGVKQLVIADYFKHERAPNLVGSDGATLTGETVSLLAGPAAPGQYAQATPQVTAVAIGRADKVSGLVQVTHANGVTEALNPGSIIYKGDAIQTGQDASLAISFGDGTTLNFFSNTRMVMNEFVYDPSSNANSGVLTLVRGSLALIAGQVATTGGLDIETPVAAMGIRGTSVVLVEIEPLRRYQFWAPEHVNPDGTLGAPSTYSLTLRTADGVIPLAQVSTGTVTILNAAGVGQVPQVTVQPASALVGTDAQGIQLVRQLFQPLVESRAHDLQNLPPPTQVVPLNGASPSTPVLVSGPWTVGASFVSAMVIAIVAWETVATCGSRETAALGVTNVTFVVDDGTASSTPSVGVSLSGSKLSASVTDPHGATVSQTATTITAGIAEPLTATHNLLTGASDVHHGETAALGVTNVTFVVDDGTASSTPSVGVSLSGSKLSASVTDPHGATVSQTATIIIAGTKDAPAIAEPLTATHNLLTGASDVHHGETAALSITNVTFVVDAGTASSTPSVGVSLSGSTLSVDPTYLADGEHQTIVAPAIAGPLTATASDVDDGETAALSITNVTFVVDAGTASSTPSVGVSLSGSTLSVDPTYLADGEHQTIVAPAIAGPLTATASDVDDGETAALGVTNVTFVVDDGTASSTPSVGVSLSGSTLSVDPTYLADGEHQTIVAPAIAGPLTATASDVDDGETAALGVTNVTFVVDDGTASSTPSVGVSLSGSTLSVDPTYLADGEHQTIVAPAIAGPLTATASDVDDGETAALGVTNVTFVVDDGTASSTPSVGVSLSGSTLSVDPTYLADGEHQTIVAPAIAGPLTATASDVDDGETAALGVTNVTFVVDDGTASSTPSVGVSLSGSTLSVDPTYLADGEHQTIVAPAIAGPLTATASDVDDGETAALGVTNVTFVVDDGTASSTPSVGVSLSGSTLSVDPTYLADGEHQTIVAPAIAGPLTATASDVDDGETAALGVTNVTFVVDDGTASSTPSVGVSLSGSTLSVDPTYLADGEHQTIVAPAIAGPLTATASDVDDGETAALGVTNVTFVVDDGTASSTPSVGVSLSGSKLSADPSNPAFAHLTLGQHETIVVPYSVTDPHGAIVSQTATITTAEANDAPVVAEPLTATHTAGDAPFTHDLREGAAERAAADKAAADKSAPERAAAEKLAAEKAAAEKAAAERAAAEKAAADAAAEKLAALKIAAEKDATLKAAAEKAVAEDAAVEAAAEKAMAALKAAEEKIAALKVAAEQAVAEKDAAVEAAAEKAMAALKAADEKIAALKGAAKQVAADKDAAVRAAAETAAAEKDSALKAAAERPAAEKAAADAAAEKLAALKIAAEKDATLKAAAEKAAAEKAAAEKAGAEKVAALKAAAVQAPAEKDYALKAAAEKAVAENVAALTAERPAAEKAAADAAAEKLAALKIAAEAAEKAAAEKAAAEKVAALKAAADQAAAEQDSALKAAAEKTAAEHASAMKIAAAENDAPAIADGTIAGQTIQAAPITDEGLPFTETAASYLSAGHSLVNELGNAPGYTNGFGENLVAVGDDNSTGEINLTSVFGPEGLNFFGEHYTSLWINNNGSISFERPTAGYIPLSFIGSTHNPIIAPFWADVDTRGLEGTLPGASGNSSGANRVFYDLDNVNHVLTITWDDVGYYNQHTDKANAFQLQLIGLTNGGDGDFDIVFRYEDIKWTTGDAGLWMGGLGGIPARAGFDDAQGHFLELPQSGTAAMLNLPSVPGNTGIPGVYVFQSHGGTIVPQLTASGVINFTDPDLADAHSAATPTFLGSGQPLGTFFLVENSDTTGTGTGGQFAWTYTVDPHAVAHLAPNETLTETFHVDISDHHGGHAFQDVAVTIVGVNDAQGFNLNGSSVDEAFVFAAPAGNLAALPNGNADNPSLHQTLSVGPPDLTQINIPAASGADTFVFRPADHVVTTINGLTPHNGANAAAADTIDLSELHFTSFEQDIQPLLDDAAEHHPNSINLPNGATITLPGIQVAWLHASDFIVQHSAAGGGSS